MFSKREGILVSKLGAETHGPGRGQKNEKSTARSRAGKQDPHSPAAGEKTRSLQPGRGRTLNMALR
ncbi:hypothetical protein DXC26_17040 [Clostridiaceae bacterium OM08-6BH]|nr:hypothetical protein DXC26_17040 [Clostridiaceae bacterium OM08-6BH]